ncbi:hypothetical protein [Parasitella parasitica]|uniref:Uncharacterized protein n=1 Tax=Parasitella parasitica TaxID=35722 RepID=A0A0B7N8Y6_9FUNG|nr:hypothetical protein [Parasitella parasitica]
MRLFAMGLSQSSSAAPLEENAAVVVDDTTTRNPLPLSKASVLHILKQTTSKDDIQIHQVDQRIGSDGIFGRSVRLPSAQGMKKHGRWLWVLKEEYHAPMNGHALYVRHIQASSSIITIGYARKSHCSEPKDARIRLLQEMINKLRSRCLTRKVYVSPRSNASMAFEQRDKNESNVSAIEELTHCAGSTQDLIHRLRTNTKPMRLVVIDYAGLSTDFSDIQELFMKYNQFVELIGDLDFIFDLVSRQDILTDKGVSAKFNCRIGPKKRKELSEDDVEVLCVDDAVMPKVIAKEVLPSPNGALASKFVLVTLQSRIQVGTANEMQALSDVRNTFKSKKSLVKQSLTNKVSAVNTSVMIGASGAGSSGVCASLPGEGGKSREEHVARTNKVTGGKTFDLTGHTR